MSFSNFILSCHLTKFAFCTCRFRSIFSGIGFCSIWLAKLPIMPIQHVDPCCWSMKYSISQLLMECLSQISVFTILNKHFKYHLLSCMPPVFACCECDVTIRKFLFNFIPFLLFLFNFLFLGGFGISSSVDSSLSSG